MSDLAAQAGFASHFEQAIRGDGHEDSIADLDRSSNRLGSTQVRAEPDSVPSPSATQPGEFVVTDAPPAIPVYVHRSFEHANIAFGA